MERTGVLVIGETHSDAAQNDIAIGVDLNTTGCCDFAIATVFIELIAIGWVSGKLVGTNTPMRVCRTLMLLQHCIML